MRIEPPKSKKDGIKKLVQGLDDLVIVANQIGYFSDKKGYIGEKQESKELLYWFDLERKIQAILDSLDKIYFK